MRLRTLPIISALVCFSYSGVGDARSASFPQSTFQPSALTLVQKIACTRQQREGCLERAPGACYESDNLPLSERRKCQNQFIKQCLAPCGGWPG
jgi:hypothetical protein